MVQLADFKEHLQQISQEEWKQLAALLPIVKETDTFGLIEQSNPLFLSVRPCPIVEDVMAQLEQMRLFPVFEWVFWVEGQKIIQQISFDYSTLDSLELGMLLTVIFRLNKFNEGYLVSKFEDGTMLRVLEVLAERHLLKD